MCSANGPTAPCSKPSVSRPFSPPPTPADASAEDLQTEIYEIGKREEFGFESLRDWFRALYETLLGSSQGPRMGSFIALYGVANTRTLIQESLASI